MSHTCHDQRYGPRSDTLADAQEQEIFNSVILTYPTEDQTGRRTAPPRQETPGPANWIRDHQRSSSHITTTREEHKLSPTSYRARFNSIQRSSSCPWSLMQFGFVMFAKRFIFFFIFLYFFFSMDWCWLQEEVEQEFLRFSKAEVEHTWLEAEETW